MLLYHGTGFHNAFHITRYGFDLTRIGENRSNYGAMGIGVYFAPSEYAAYGYGNFIVECDITCAILSWSEACVQADLAGLANLDGWQRWDLCKSRRWSERISLAMQRHCIGAVCNEEVCVYDTNLIRLVRWYESQYVPSSFEE